MSEKSLDQMLGIEGSQGDKLCTYCEHILPPDKNSSKGVTDTLCAHPSNIKETRGNDGTWARQVIKPIEKLNPDGKCKNWEASLSYLHTLKLEREKEKERKKLLKELTANPSVVRKSSLFKSVFQALFGKPDEDGPPR